MKIRRFYSKNMRLALRQVTEVFGEDAAILSSQKTPTGVEVIAALDYDEDLLPNAISNSRTEGETKLPSSKPVEKTRSAKFEIVENSSIEDNTNLVQPIVSESKIDLKGVSNEERLGLKDDQESVSLPTFQEKDSSNSKVASLQWATDPGLSAMREELGLMRTMMTEQFKGLSWQRFTEKDPTKAMLTRRLVSLGIDQKISTRLIPKVKLNQDAECSWQNLLVLLAKSIQVNCQNILTEGGIFAFMGPTGAGKTTSIAKIAARYVIKHGTDSVALISTDNYRISAQQQLASFAKLLGVTMQSVTNKRSLDDLLHKFKDKKLVLIDTAGMSHKDTGISKQLDTLQNTGMPIKKFLLMPATNQLPVLKQSIELFKKYSPFSVIVTKLDEAASLGEVLSLVIENSLPIAFTTDGQRVPEDIRLARNHHLVSKAVWLANKYGTNPEDWRLAQEQQLTQYG